MKKLLIVFIAFAMWQCQKDSGPDPRSAAFGEDLVLSKGQSAMLNQNGGNADLMVETKDIQESRCPSDVICVWAGFATASLKLSHNGATGDLDLCLGSCAEKYNVQDTGFISLDNVNYGVILKEIAPFPTSQNGNEPKTAVVEVFIK